MKLQSYREQCLIFSHKDSSQYPTREGACYIVSGIKRKLYQVLNEREKSCRILKVFHRNKPRTKMASGVEVSKIEMVGF